MNMFGKAKDMYKLQQQAKQIKAQLANIHIEATEGGVTVTINGEQECIKVKIDSEYYKKDSSLTRGDASLREAEGSVMNNTQLEKDMETAINKGIKKSQAIAADKMKDVMGSMGLGM